MIELTEAATKYLLDAIDPGDYVRIGIRGGGCSGFMYDLEIEEEASKGDVIVELENLKICMDPQSAFMLSETVIDYQQTLTQSGFKFSNNKATKSCGCGKSFSSACG
jgi:iron-sulfur cluster assembly protein